MLRRPHDRHRDIRTRTRFARLALDEIRIERHDRKRVSRHPANGFSSPGPSTAPLALAQRSSSRLSRARPQPKISSRGRQRTPLATLDPSKSSLMVRRLPAKRRRRRSNPHSSPHRIGACDSRFPSLEVFERRPLSRRDDKCP